MPLRRGTFHKTARNVSHSRLECSNKDRMGALEREKHSFSGSQLPTADIPMLITAPTDAASQHEMLLRTKSKASHSRSESSTSQKMYLASQQNGFVVTSNRKMDTPWISAKNSAAFSEDESTLPTFMSVGASVDNRRHDLDSTNMFLVSKENTEDSPMVSMSCLATTSPTMSGMGDSVQQQRETRKRQHRYKEKLCSLTERLTTSATVERSKKMISTIVDRGNAVVKEKSNAVFEAGDENDLNEDLSTNNNIIESIKKKLYACSMSICLEEAIADQEGMLISVPCRCAEAEDFDDVELDKKASDISSLSGYTNHRFFSRHWKL